MDLGRNPPQNISAEQAALGSMLLQEEAILHGVDILRPEDFYKKSHQIIFRCILELFEKSKGVDLVTLTEELNRINLLEEIGGVTYLTNLINSVPTAANIEHYVKDLKNIIDMETIRSAGLKIGADAMGGSGFAYWSPIAEQYGLDIDIINGYADPSFSFMTVDVDGKIRMDCSSKYAMAGLINLKDKYDIAFGNDPDFDRHGIVTPEGGLLNPNHYLSIAIDYLFKERKGWRHDASIGKTIVSSSMIDRIAGHLGKNISEVPVGFKWFVDGLISGSCGIAGEESAGASFLRMDGSVWTTDKDGFIMDLLAAEITARTGRDPCEQYRLLEELFGASVYERIDAAATPKQKDVLKRLSPDQVTASVLAGEKILARLTEAPGNGAAIGGLKVITENGWFAARPSGTEDIYKIYAESFKGRAHLELIQEEAGNIIKAVFISAGV